MDTWVHSLSSLPFLCQHIWTNVSESLQALGTCLEVTRLECMVDMIGLLRKLEFSEVTTELAAFTHSADITLHSHNACHLGTVIFCDEICHHFWFYLLSYPLFFMFSTFSFKSSNFVLMKQY